MFDRILVPLDDTPFAEAAIPSAEFTPSQAITTIRSMFDLSGRVAIVAGAGFGLGRTFTSALADWQRVVDVNLTGVFLGARAAARTMIAAGSGGRIVNIASILGAVASEPLPATAYAASKGGVINLTRDLAVEWAPHGILVNAIAPA